MSRKNGMELNVSSTEHFVLESYPSYPLEAVSGEKLYRPIIRPSSMLSLLTYDIAYLLLQLIGDEIFCVRISI